MSDRKIRSSRGTKAPDGGKTTFCILTRHGECDGLWPLSIYQQSLDHRISVPCTCPCHGRV